jgi:acetyltransferase EpsM
LTQGVRGDVRLALVRSINLRERNEIREPETSVDLVQPEVQMQSTDLDDDLRVAIVGAGGYGRVALDVLIAGGAEGWVLGFYDDARSSLSSKVRGFPVLGDIGMLKSMLSVESVHVIVAITDNVARLRVSNSLRGLGGKFSTAVHPTAYLSEEASVGDGSVVAASAVVHPDAAVGSHCYLGPGSVVERDAVVGAGVWLAAGAVVGEGARVGARSLLGYNASVGRKAFVEADVRVSAAVHFEGEME